MTPLAHGPMDPGPRSDGRTDGRSVGRVGRLGQSDGSEARTDGWKDGRMHRKMDFANGTNPLASLEASVWISALTIFNWLPSLTAVPNPTFGLLGAFIAWAAFHLPPFRNEQFFWL